MEQKLQRITYADSYLPESYVFEGGREDAQVPIIFSVFLITLKDRKILVDAGCDTMPGFEMRNFRSPVLALAEKGVQAQEITDVILTHAHHDHIEAVHYFENALIHIAQEAYENGRKYIPEHFRVNAFQDEFRLCEEVRVVKIGGHSRGSCIVEVTIDEKDYVLCGDECYVHYNLTNRIPTAKRYSLERSQYFIDKYSNSRYICLLSHEE